MLTKDMRQDILNRLREDRQQQIQNVDRLQQNRNYYQLELKRDISHDRQQQITEIDDSQSPEKWEELIEQNKQEEEEEEEEEEDIPKDIHDLSDVNREIQYQLKRNQEMNNNYNLTLQRFEAEHQKQQPDQYQQLEDRIRNFSEQRRNQIPNQYNCHSDDEDIQQYYSEETDQNQKKLVYMNSVVKKYGNKSIASHRVCRKKNEVKENYSYKPETHDLPRQIYGDQASYKLELSKEEIWERLLQTKRDQLELREQQKRYKDMAEFQEKCTFKPTIGPISRSLVHNYEPVEERLFRKGEESKKNKELLKLQKNEREQYSFNPEIDQQYLKGDKANLRPLYERIDEVIKKRQEELLQKKLEQENKIDQSFKPKISEKSNQLAELKLSSKCVVERLMQDAFEKVQRRINEQQQHQQPISDECTFKPVINPTFDFDRVAQQDFVQKQYLVADFIKEKKEKLLQEFMKSQNYTFKPEVNRQSALLVEADLERMEETDQQKYIRLSRKDHDKKVIIQEQIQEAYYNQFTYQPKINQISSVIGRKRSLQSLAYNKEGQQRLKQKREEAELVKMHECSFQPQIQKKDQYSHVQSKYAHDKIKENLELEDQLRKRKIDELQKQQEYIEFKECTFKPHTNKEVQFSADSLQEKVRGLDKFILNKENHRKQQQDKREREKDLFDISSKYDINKHTTETKLKPFNLSQKNQNLQRQIYEEAIKKEKDECTFKPKINKKTVLKEQNLNDEYIYDQF